MVQRIDHNTHLVSVFDPPSEHEGFEDCYDIECTCGMHHHAESREEALAVAELHERLGAEVVSSVSDIERTARGLHEIADMPGEDSYFVDLSADHLSVWVCGVCPVGECDWTGELVTERDAALDELAAHLLEDHGLHRRERGEVA